MPSTFITQKLLLDSLKTAILLIDEDKTIKFANTAAEEFLQISNSRVKGIPVTDIFEKPGLINNCFERLANNSGSIIIKEIAIKTADEKRKITTCAINPLPRDLNDLINQAYASIEIISENRFSILEPGIKNQDIANNNQTLLQGMAHEIKNPLGGIRGAAQLLAANLIQREDKDYINIILHETDRLNKLVDRMSGHIKDKRMLPINVHRILEHIFKLLEADEQNNYSIKRDYDPSLPQISGSESSLVQAFLNLALNASQALDSGGKIILRSRMAYGILIKDKQHRQTIRIDIQDNGIGIDEDIKDNIFEPLISSKSQGTGIGLSITKEIISMHQGKIEFSSEPGKTVFSVYLPILENKS